jgi:hypothetical protein
MTQIIRTVSRTPKSLTLHECNVIWGDWDIIIDAALGCKVLTTVVLVNLQVHGMLVPAHTVG